MSITFRHSHEMTEIKNGKKHLIKENIIDGEKGLTIMLLEKVGDSFYKIHLKTENGKTFQVSEKVDDKQEEVKTMPLADVKTLLKKRDSLKFALDYLTKSSNEKPTKVDKPEKKASKKKASQKGGSKKKTKKTKKSSKKARK